MIIQQERFTSDDNTSLSLVFIDEKFQCFHVEDEHRDNKVPKETRIPEGAYRVGVRTWGGFYRRYREKFPSFHKGMLEILDVPGFTDILFHIGNLESNTDGCQLSNYGVMAKPGQMSGQCSTDAYVDFYKTVIDAALAGNLYINIIDRDR